MAEGQDWLTQLAEAVRGPTVTTPVVRPPWEPPRPAPGAPAPPPLRPANLPVSVPTPPPGAGPVDPHTQDLLTIRNLYRRILGREPTGGELSRDLGLLTQYPNDPGTVGLAIIQAHRPELVTGTPGATPGAPPAQPGLRDSNQLAQFRAMTKDFAAQSEAAGQANSGMRPDQWQRLLAQADPTTTLSHTLESIPMPFLGGPDVLVHPSQIDTPEKLTAYLQGHGGDTPLNRALVQAAQNYGGLSIEPTPYGTANRAGGSHSQWYLPHGNQPGDLESRLTAALGRGETPGPGELSGVAQERESAYRLRDPNAIEHMAMKALGAAIAAYATGAVAGPALGALGAGAGIPGTAAGIGTATANAGALGGFAGFGGGAAGGAAGTAFASRGDPRATLIGAATGGVGGGLAGILPKPTSLGMGALQGAGRGAAQNLVGQGLGGQGIDWTKLLQSAGTGAATGTAAGLPQAFPGENVLTGIGTGVGGSLLSNASRDPFAAANTQLDRNAVTQETDRAAALQAAQEDWKRQFADAQAAAQAEAQGRFDEARRNWEDAMNARQAAQLQAFRDAQQQYEAQRAQYQQQLQAFINARDTQIRDALRTMGTGETTIASILAEHRQAIEDQQKAQEAQLAQTLESRQFFPSQGQAHSPGLGDFATSSVLAPGAPAFGPEGLPASQATQNPLAFSPEGMLPSGSLASPTPAAAPTPPTPAPAGPSGYFPTLLSGLTRSPYLLRFG